MNEEISKKHFDELEKFFNSETDYDVKIYVGEEPNVKEVHAHSVILQAHCSFFKNALSNITKEKGYYIIKKPNISELVFKTILKFIYTCKIELSDYTGSNMLKLLFAAEELELQLLYEYVQDYFIENHNIKKNPVKILRLVHDCENFTKLRDTCLEKICENSERLFKSSEFELLEEPVLLEILKIDDFCVEEIDVWENVLKWGLARHPDINDSGIKYWTKQNFVDLGNTLKEFIPLIRFKDISNEDFRYKIIPYKKIFPKYLWETLLDYYLIPDKYRKIKLLPSRNPKKGPILESITIVGRNHLLTFASWIDKKDPHYTSLKEVKYEFKLLYRSSRDGLNYDTFHKKCDNINKTLVVAKTRNSEQIFGGYNPLDWYGGGSYKNATGSFIFNITDRSNTGATKYISYNINNNNAIYCNYNYLPTFGSGHDLQFNTNNTISVSTNNTYNSINLNNGNAYEELEVFQIINK